MSIVVTTNEVAPVTEAAEVKPQSEPAVNAGETSEKSEISAQAEESAPDEAETSEENEAGEESENDETLEAKPKKQAGINKRFGKLTAEKKALLAEREYWRAEALKNQAAPKEVIQEAAPVETAGKPQANDFETFEEYTEALTDWKIEQKEAKKEADKKLEAIKGEYQKTVSAHEGRIEEYKKQQPDYEEKVKDYIAEHGEIVFSPALSEAVVTSDFGPQIVYALVSDKAEFDRIMSLGPVAAAREIGKMEARFQKETSKEKEINATKAPKPIAPIAAKSTKSHKSVYDPDLSQAEYERLRAKDAQA